jgi:hypothetical protein
MSRTPDSLAPPWLPRPQRRRIDRQLRQLMQRDVCSVCGSPHGGHSGEELAALITKYAAFREPGHDA